MLHLNINDDDDDDDITGGGSSDESDVETEPGLTLRRKVRMENYGTIFDFWNQRSDDDVAGEESKDHL